MDATITTRNLKSRLDRKEITVVETLAPARYQKRTFPDHLFLSVGPRESPAYATPPILLRAFFFGGRCSNRLA